MINQIQITDIYNHNDFDEADTSYTVLKILYNNPDQKIAQEPRIQIRHCKPMYVYHPSKYVIRKHINPKHENYIIKTFKFYLCFKSKICTVLFILPMKSMTRQFYVIKIF